MDVLVSILIEKYCIMTRCPRITKRSAFRLPPLGVVSELMFLFSHVSLCPKRDGHPFLFPLCSGNFLCLLFDQKKRKNKKKTLQESFSSLGQREATEVVVLLTPWTNLVQSKVMMNVWWMHKHIFTSQEIKQNFPYFRLTDKYYVCQHKHGFAAIYGDTNPLGKIQLFHSSEER